jgi:hypothetical protein
VYGSKDIASTWKLLIILGATTFGVFICLVGYAVIQREGAEWYTAYEIVKRAMLYLGLYDVEFEVKNRSKLLLMPKQPTFAFSRMKESANKKWYKLFSGLVKGELGIRDYFQTTFLLCAILFVAFLVFSYLTLCYAS